MTNNDNPILDMMIALHLTIDADDSLITPTPAELATAIAFDESLDNPITDAIMNAIRTLLTADDDERDIELLLMRARTLI